jgi:hypothetical protein
MNAKTCIISGTKALVAIELINVLLESNHYLKIKFFTDKKSTITHPKLEEYLIDGDKWQADASLIQADDIFILLERNLKTLKNNPIQLAQQALSNGAKQLILLSHLNANPTAKQQNYQLQGQWEEVFKTLDFQAIHFLKPYLVIGDHDEIRPAHDLARVFNLAFTSFLPLNYRAIKSLTVAKFMEGIAQKNKQGIFEYPTREIRKIEKRYFDLQEVQEKTTYINP